MLTGKLYCVILIFLKFFPLQKKISILGCGWLGLPLAKAFINDNYQVSGSTTTPEKIPVLKNFEIIPFLLDLENLELNSANEAFFQTETLVINVPPRRNSGNSYAAQIRNLQPALLKTEVKQVIFISSTSVYANAPGPVSETSELEKEKANELIMAERIMAAPENTWQTTIIRFAGLFGPGRQPGRFLAGKTNLPDPESPVNLIHLEDCIGIIKAVVNQQKWGEIFNACADAHPTRKTFYQAAARKLNLPEPTFIENQESEPVTKLISSQKLKNSLQYAFKFPDPLKALETEAQNGMLLT